MTSRDLTPGQIAYGCLWRYATDCHAVNSARASLRDSLSTEEAKAGIAWAIKQWGPMSTRELIAADIRGGWFPEKSFDTKEPKQ